MEIEDLVRKILAGVRLSRPKVATLTVYNVLIRCWLVDPEARPTFNDLKNVFGKFVLDPRKYINLSDTKEVFVTINAEIDPELTTNFFYEDARTLYGNQSLFAPSQPIGNETNSVHTVTFRRPLKNRMHSESTNTNKYENKVTSIETTKYFSRGGSFGANNPNSNIKHYKFLSYNF